MNLFSESTTLVPRPPVEHDSDPKQKVLAPILDPNSHFRALTTIEERILRTVGTRTSFVLTRIEDGEWTRMCSFRSLAGCALSIQRLIEANDILCREGFSNGSINIIARTNETLPPGWNVEIGVVKEIDVWRVALPQLLDHVWLLDKIVRAHSDHIVTQFDTVTHCLEALVAVLGVHDAQGENSCGLSV